jgi:hypothetical protein
MGQVFSLFLGILLATHARGQEKPPDNPEKIRQDAVAERGPRNSIPALAWCRAYSSTARGRHD